ncbi:MAG: adenylate/guanylate cyclase domain-containing protein [Archangiaceae bacterium]|nr:adenylate/guanylate cyclase domain-containing protein [Archangiaceae bacterium]
MGLLSRWRYVLLAVVVALVCCVLHLRVSAARAIGLTEGSDPIVRALQLAEARSYDLRFRVRGPVAPHPAITVVAIDEKSAQKFGLPPWPRQRMATAIEHLVDAGARAIALDITYTDEAHDESAVYRDLLSKFDADARGDPAHLAAFRSELSSRANASNDEALARAFAKAGPRLVQGLFMYPDSDAKDFSPETISEQNRVLDGVLIRSVPGPGGTTRELPIDKIEAYAQRSAQTPLKIFTTQGNRLGHLNIVPDVDGTTRRSPAVATLTGPKGFLPCFEVQAAAIFRGAQIIPRWTSSFYLEAIDLKGPDETVSWPIEDNEPFALINHVGPASSFRTISIADVIDGTFKKEDLDGKLVLVGVTLTGSSGDQRVTPFKEIEPGIYPHASVASNLLRGDFMQRPTSLTLLELAGMVLVALGLGLAIPRARSFAVKGAIIAALLIAWAALAQLLFNGGLLLATVLPLSNVVATSFGLIFLGYLSVDREKLKLRSTFTRYLGEDVMEEALKNPDKLNRGEKREMTVLFSDIRGFTTLSERMLPEKLAAFINEYLSPMTRIVFEEKGTLDKYIGDAVMAFWNAPTEQPDHALRACRAAWAMLQKLEELKAKWRAENYPEFDIGVGINTGPMIVGNMGSDVRVDYTVMGDAVNLGSRLEGTNKEYDTKIILGEGTYPSVKDQVIARRLGAVRVKGKRKPVEIYELRGIGKAAGAEAEAIARFDEGLDAYVEQKWDVAEAAFKRVLELWPDDAPTRRYLEEIPQLRAQPPGPGWDGVYTATHK